VTLTPSGGTLSSCAGLTASSGVITVTGCKFAGIVGTGYTLTAQTTSAPVVSGTSASFSPSTFGTATQIVLSGVTSGLGSGGTRTFTATIEDSGGNAVTSGADSSRSVTFAQTGGTGSVTGLGAFTANMGVATDTVTGNVAGQVTLQASAVLTQGSTNSNTLTFSVTGAPTVTSPTAGSPCNPGHNGTANCIITGSNFEVGVTVTISANGAVNSVTFNSTGQITINVTGSGGNHALGNIVITNPDGGTATCTNCFKNG
jgi:hypothetical protein